LQKFLQTFASLQKFLQILNAFKLFRPFILFYFTCESSLSAGASRPLGPVSQQNFAILHIQDAGDVILFVFEKAFALYVTVNWPVINPL